jgi:hypothetical protein
MNRIGVISFDFGCGCWLRSAFYSHDEREAAGSTAFRLWSAAALCLS